MTTPWEPATAGELEIGDRVRLPTGVEFAVARIVSPLLGMEGLVCLIEDTSVRWHAHPAGAAQPVEVQRA